MKRDRRNGEQRRAAQARGQKRVAKAAKKSRKKATAATRQNLAHQRVNYLGDA